MKQITVLAFLLLTSVLSYGQNAKATHNSNQPNSTCKYAKNRCRNAEGCNTCFACIAEEDKARAAKEEARQKQAKASYEKSRAEAAVAAAAAKKKRAEDDARANAGKVYINGDGPTKGGAVPTKPAKPALGGQKVYIIGNGRLYNGTTNDEIPAPENMYYEARIGAGSLDYNRVIDPTNVQYEFPANTAVVQFRNINATMENHPFGDMANGQSYPVWDILDKDHKRTFNSNSVAHIDHLYGNWFIIGYDFKNRFNFGFVSAKLYNVATKQYIDIPERVTPIGAVHLREFKSHGMTLLGRAYNYHYISGKFSTTTPQGHPVTREEADQAIDGLLGGPSKWKAFVVVSTGPRGVDMPGVVYYVDENNKIQKATASADVLKGLPSY
ncbi:hypothetical protein GCM10027048_38950 [Hymenobacter coalescens]